ncbi:BTB/POZ domain-containing protein At1g63850-like [Panicum virgatum]|uniref:BTB domain-containing protein n=1 Tax=Panicum virgatum TaxID=38727 RepID=A0A8T0XL25_PANVG|nr:BTB/POZ domain-containing protein At1g63850-like [Panicum virgatum]KAG2659885.1 hypothetical protein PVAP13_1KG398305 [Panicum virgatum]
MLYGKEGIAVRMGVHRDVLCQSSAFFAARLAGGHGPPAPCVEIHDCDDAKIYVETVSCITARLFVGIGREEMLPSKNTRLSLLQEARRGRDRADDPDASIGGSKVYAAVMVWEILEVRG